jgi:hypothetical protein
MVAKTQHNQWFGNHLEVFRVDCQVEMPLTFLEMGKKA